MFSIINSSELAVSLAWTLVHSLWQFTLIGLLLALVLKFIKTENSTKRYAVSFAALGFSLIVSVITFASYYSVPEQISATVEHTLQYQVAAGLVDSSLAIAETKSFIEMHAPTIFIAWLIGVLLFLLKFFGGMFFLKTIVKKATPLHTDISKSIKKLNKTFDISRTILFKESQLIYAPMVMGFFKPVILFPIGLVNNLSVKEVEAIIAHEMAHIKRHDYFFNIIQSFVEVAFYYHPAIWYISNTIRNERENCCDDLAIEATGNSMMYAKTLVKLQELKGTQLKPALSFNGQSGAFKNRIMRIIGNPEKATFFKYKFMIATFVLSGIFTNGDQLSNQTIAHEDPEFDIYIIDDCPMDTEDISLYLDTIPQRNSYEITKKTIEGEINLQMENGEISKLKIDGKNIPESQFEEHSNIIEKLKPKKGQDLITVFPDCGDTFGKVYWLDRENGQAINLDSMLSLSLDKTMDLDSILAEAERKLHFSLKPGQNLPLFSNPHLGRMEEMLLDTLNQEFKSFDFHAFEETQKNHIDSIFDLFPNKFGKEDLFPQHFSNEFESLEESRTSLFDLLNEKREYENVTVADVLSRSLLKDEIIEKSRISQIEITEKHFKINGEKQPSNLHKKYKNMYERNTGISIVKGTKILLDVDPAKCVQPKKPGISM